MKTIFVNSKPVSHLYAGSKGAHHHLSLAHTKATHVTAI